MVGIQKTTRNRLRKMKGFEKTYTEIVNELLDEYEQ